MSRSFSIIFLIMLVLSLSQHTFFDVLVCMDSLFLSDSPSPSCPDSLPEPETTCRTTPSSPRAVCEAGGREGVKRRWGPHDVGWVVSFPLMEVFNRELAVCCWSLGGRCPPSSCKLLHDLWCVTKIL